MEITMNITEFNDYKVKAEGDGIIIKIETENSSEGKHSFLRLKIKKTYSEPNIDMQGTTEHGNDYFEEECLEEVEIDISGDMWVQDQFIDLMAKAFTVISNQKKANSEEGEQS